jgi:hypothetical protein
MSVFFSMVLSRVHAAQNFPTGNFSEVYKAWWQGTTQVAVKMLKNQEQLEVFLAEAAMLAYVLHA